MMILFTMSNFPLLSDALYTQEGVVARKKSFVIPAILLVVGAAVAVWSLQSPGLAENKSLSSALMLIGGLVALYGLIRLLVGISARVPYYAPTGERLRSKKIFFELSERAALLAAFQAGDLDRIMKLARTNSSNVLLVCYTTPSGSCILAQVQEYVPHEFVPVTDVATFTHEGAKSPLLSL